MNRFAGDAGRRLRIEAFKRQRLLEGNAELAERLADISDLVEIDAGTSIIKQGDYTNDIFFILVGSFSIDVNGRHVATRGTGDHVGEMAAVEPTQERSATVTATQKSLVAKITEAQFDELGAQFPALYKFIAKELARRLLQRNIFVRPTNERIRVFLICSVEALPVARLIQSGLQHDPLDVIIWSDGVFKVTNYTLDTLESEVDQADFAIAVAHGDDIAEIREKEWPVPRDNVIFELGLFMGRLGRSRAILMEPREEKVKLPSDVAGVTTIGYKYSPGKDEASHMAPAVNALRGHIRELGPQ
ncbi:TIR domain-containing protein [Burkholderia cepacia]|uniref:TIR domain-containing protein n=1 Tax=Burkholderia cepacia TaxID=292 RepID=UPI0020195A1E|nr:TIR domain-containing protein [Burkholderia cepacia]UQO38359.1 nucleotide-binding protein [Burkholderia cepacia]UQO52696.1 nucleotide-binding protein [Burkholderia cepacia]UQP06843.1 nucleotide-binding protein [Burkholderia cepacia]